MKKWIRVTAAMLLLLIGLCGCMDGSLWEMYQLCRALSAYTETSASVRYDYPVEDCTGLTKTGRSVTLVNNRLMEDTRPRYGLGTCHTLSGEQTVVLFFMDDDESRWTKEDVIDFTDQKILPALDFLEKQAQSWGVELDFTVKRYSTALSGGLQMTYGGSVIKDLNVSGSTKDLPAQIAALMGCDRDDALLRALMEEFETESVIPLMLLNKDGVAYARAQLSPGLGGHVEHAVVFADHLGHPAGSWRRMSRREATVAHEILHLFGAEDYYLDEGRIRLAEKYYPNDIMLLDTFRLSRLTVDAYTGYCVGWTDEVPAICSEEAWYETYEG